MSDWRYEETNPEYESINIYEYLGKGEAVLEWGNKRDTASKFLHTKNYEDFKRHDKIILFGLRGSGKTAMINMLHYEVSNKYNVSYSFSTIINQDEAYNELANSIQQRELRNLPQGTLIYNNQAKMAMDNHYIYYARFNR